MEAAIQDLPRRLDPFELAFHVFDLDEIEIEIEIDVDTAPGPSPRFVWAAQDSEVTTLPSVIVDEALLMDDWFFTEVADDDQLEMAGPPRDVTRWLVTAGAVSSLLVALLTL